MAAWCAARKRGMSLCPKLMFKWTGPYMVMNRLSDVVYRIQQSAKCKPKVVHLDRLKVYTGPELNNWLMNN